LISWTKTKTTTENKHEHETVDGVGNGKGTNNNNSKNNNVYFIPALEAMKRHAETFDKMWAKELYETNKADRVAIQYELHGVQSRAIPETPERIKSALEEMEREIANTVCIGCRSSEVSVTAAGTAARQLVNGHLLAVEDLHSCSYVVSPRFRIRFLRAEFFDAKKAALRYLKCLNILLGAFGEASFRRPLQIEDLSNSEKIILESGRVQVMVNRDRMGRRIFLFFYGRSTEPIWERQKVELYLIFGVLAEDETTQLHGAVAVILNAFKEEGGGNGGEASAWESREQTVLTRLTRHKLRGRQLYFERSKASPIRWSSVHLCIPNERVYLLLKSFFLGFVPSAYRSMVKVHTGSYIECRYELRQYGIPVEELPTTTAAKGVLIKSKSLTRFLKARAAIDSFRRSRVPTEDFCPGTDCPESNCVVFGDRFTYKYQANVAFREYLQTKERCHFHSDEATAPPAATTTAAIAIAEISTTNSAPSPSGNNTKAVLRLNAQVLDEIINELCDANNANVVNGASFSASSSENYRTKGFRFAIFDKEAGWYRYIDPIQNENDRIELRKKISQTMRDDRKRAMKSKTAHGQHQADQLAAAVVTVARRGGGRQQQLAQGMSTSSGGIDTVETCFGNIGARWLGTHNHNITSFTGHTEIDAKRFKRDHYSNEF
jgi:hypothetical protein